VKRFSLNRLGSRPNADAVQLEAEVLAARLPPLLAEADRVASTVAQGVHGRRRAGSGDSFWQYRQLMPGESISRIDWRQSARSSRAYVRETEWEAAQTVCLWRDASPSMDWRSADTLPTKRGRAELLTLALSLLLLRGGEHVRLLEVDGVQFRFSGRLAAERLARQLLERSPGPAPSLPPEADLPRHARLVLVGDFLSPLPEIAAMLSRLAAAPVLPLLVQLLDPAEQNLPYEGRVRFDGIEGESSLLVSRVQDVRTAYAAAFDAHQRGLAALCAATGSLLLHHRTDQPPHTALLTLHETLGRRKHFA
jgi:uncharacterized protein (DUF58 family)